MIGNDIGSRIANSIRNQQLTLQGVWDLAERRTRLRLRESLPHLAWAINAWCPPHTDDGPVRYCPLRNRALNVAIASQNAAVVLGYEVWPAVSEDDPSDDTIMDIGESIGGLDELQASEKAEIMLRLNWLIGRAGQEHWRQRLAAIENATPLLVVLIHYGCKPISLITTAVAPQTLADACAAYAASQPLA